MELKRNKIRNTQYAIRDTKYAFTLVEILIVVAILGILAAITLPILQGHITEAKEAAAKDTLRILRNTIELYAAQHNGVPPGYPGDRTNATPNEGTFYTALVRKHHILKPPRNPFNNLFAINAILNNQPMPTAPTGQYGWIYKASTKDFRIDWPGTDSKGIAYYNY